MTDRSAGFSDTTPLPTEIDRRVAHPSRMYDYLLGGKDHFAVDRDAVHQAAPAVGGLDNARTAVRANRAFLGRAVRYLATEAGLRQFLDIGTGIPNADNVHAVAQRAAPESRIVYVDNDPIVLAHAHVLLTGTPQGATSYVHGDLREPGTILRRAAETLDFTRPIAVMLVSMLHFVPDEDDPYGIVAELMRATSPGSHLAVSHLAADINPEGMAELAQRFNSDDTVGDPFVMRDRAAVARFFDGLELVEPGVVPVDHWRPDEGAGAAGAVATGDGVSGVRLNEFHAAVGRKP